MKKNTRQAAIFSFGGAPLRCGAAHRQRRPMGDAMSLDQVKALMNAETLYPQKTGYIELDRMLEELVAPYKGKEHLHHPKGSVRLDCEQHRLQLGRVLPELRPGLRPLHPDLRLDL